MEIAKTENAVENTETTEAVKTTETKEASIDKKSMNKLVKFVADNQNDTDKLNAGQIREMIRLVLIGASVHLLDNEFYEINQELQKDSLTAKTIKQRTISYHEAELEKLKA